MTVSLVITLNIEVLVNSLILFENGILAVNVDQHSELISTKTSANTLKILLESDISDQKFGDFL